MLTKITRSIDYLTPIAFGSPASPGIGMGQPKIIRELSENDKIQENDILVIETTTFIPAMKQAAAIVVEKGETTCHVAIYCREMGIPCVIKAKNAISILKEQPIITVDGYTGNIFNGDVSRQLSQIVSNNSCSLNSPIKTKLYVNMSDPEAANKIAKLDVDGVGLLRAEFMMAHLGKHPKAVVESGNSTEYIQQLSNELRQFTSVFYPRPVVYRFSDFKTNEYKNLIGGEQYESNENNPMLGYRGCIRHIKDPSVFLLEAIAIKQVKLDFDNLWVMFPFVRTPQELLYLKSLLESHGLHRSQNFKIWMMIEVPSNIFLIDEFIKVGIDGVSIGSNDLTQLILGVDRSNEKVISVFNEMDPAVLSAMNMVLTRCLSSNVTTSICGEAPSIYPDLIKKLVSWNITSISVSPHVSGKVRQHIYNAENSKSRI